MIGRLRFPFGRNFATGKRHYGASSVAHPLDNVADIVIVASSYPTSVCPVMHLPVSFYPLYA